jgi:hypothetical protein
MRPLLYLRKCNHPKQMLFDFTIIKLMVWNMYGKLLMDPNCHFALKSVTTKLVSITTWYSRCVQQPALCKLPFPWPHIFGNLQPPADYEFLEDSWTKCLQKQIHLTSSPCKSPAKKQQNVHTSSVQDSLTTSDILVSKEFEQALLNAKHGAVETMS